MSLLYYFSSQNTALVVSSILKPGTWLLCFPVQTTFVCDIGMYVYVHHPIPEASNNYSHEMKLN